MRVARCGVILRSKETVMTRTTYDGKDYSIVVAVFPEAYEGSDAIFMRMWGTTDSPPRSGEYASMVALIRRMSFRAAELARLRGCSRVIIDARYARVSSDFSIEIGSVLQGLESQEIDVAMLNMPASGGGQANGN